MMDTKDMLLEFSAKPGVSGMEGEAVRYAADLLSSYGVVEISPLGSVICGVRAPAPGEPHVLLDAHIDQIGMVVTYIEDSGFLRVAGCGGVDRRLLLASSVTVHTKDGAVEGVVCSVPPHLGAGEDKKNKKVEDIYIDIGCEKDLAARRVALGDRVTIQGDARPLLDGRVSGPAMDDRAGCVALIKAIEYLQGIELHCGLTVAFTTMEEIGGQGARTAAYSVNPTHGIAVDVSFAHTPDAPREKCGLMGKGPMIGYAPVLSPALSDLLVTIAREEVIPWQVEVMGGRTHTNADQIAATREGVVTGLVSIPLKYMHTPIETVLVEDVENTAQLLAAYLKRAGTPKGGMV